MKHANEFDGRFCAARRRTEVAQNSESTEEEYFIPDGRKVTTINELQPPQKPATKRASIQIVGEPRERENSPEIYVQQPRRTTLQTTPLTKAEQAEEEYVVRKSGRQRNQTKRYGFTNLISKLPLWIVAVFMIIMIPEIHAIEARGCQCQNKKLLGSLDLSKYTQCEKVADKPSPRKVTYEIFAMKKASVFFPATLCKVIVQSITQETGGDIIGIAGALGTKKEVGHASKGGMTFIWQTDASDQKKPCDYESITKNDGYLYDSENKRLRVRDPERQVDFILDAQSANIDCNFTTKVWHVRGGFSDVLLSLAVENTTVIENELSEAQRPNRILAAICPKRRKPNKKEPDTRAIYSVRNGVLRLRLPALENGERSHTKPEEVPLTDMEVKDMTTEHPYGLNIIP
ncbi:hypothetical protein BV898_15143 [Hypsibius exemplaris]|uniref:Uncharacterized protein n=1 Tax=Hypsibius exemplaris TaxID=2072580 RepID=A0A9X6NDH0_HYPEX|nr:hypothetical protein BV898_15143 [Hypsibius exemplaris]